MSQTGVVTDVMSLPTTGGGLEAEAQELDEQPLPLFLRSSIFPLLAIIIAAVVWAAMAQVADRSGSWQAHHDAADTGRAAIRNRRHSQH
jgi:hypothetical protein